MERNISEKFQLDLSNDFLKDILNYVRNDHTLLLAIRNGYINIYYRGGSLLRLAESEDGYNAFFNKDYIKSSFPKDLIDVPALNNLPNKVTNAEDSLKWIKAFSELKIIMDYYFISHSKVEREFQQVVARENNKTLAKTTDYFITDIETAQGNVRFDMIAIKKHKSNFRLAFIEMKYGNNSLASESGLVKHLEDFNKLIDSDGFFDGIKDMTLKQLNCLSNLELIPLKETRNAFIVDTTPEFIFLFANHNPRSSILLPELEKVKNLMKPSQYDLRFFIASSAGYGLFKECMFNIDDFITLIKQYKEVRKEE